MLVLESRIHEVAMNSLLGTCEGVSSKLFVEAEWRKERCTVIISANTNTVLLIK